MKESSGEVRARKPGVNDLDFTAFRQQVEAPGLDELIARARALRPLLRENQAETERLSQPPLVVQQALLDAGFFKILTPKRYGGWEMGMWPFSKIVLELAQGCPSTAWCYCLGYGHVYTAAAFFPPEAQDVLFADDGYLCAASFGFPCGKATRVEGGYLISGDFPYGSGSPYSNFYMGEAAAPAGSPHGPEGTPLFFAVRHEQYQLMDDWQGILGLRGSGSQSVRLKESFVPDVLVVPTNFSNLRAVDGETFGYRHHNNPFFRLPQLALASCYNNAVMVGTAYAALDEYESVAKTKKPLNISALNLPKLKVQAQLPEVQKNFGLAMADVKSAEGLLYSNTVELDRMGREGYTPEEELNVALRNAVVGRLVWKAMEDTLWRTIGSSQGREGCRMERYWRDMSIYWNSPNNGLREPVATAYSQMRWAETLGAVEEEVPHYGT
jgi:3-hydroxy-9,10-secoandrosta-1,3,5(10)-triene-9,17-dione monooxygenase